MADLGPVVTPAAATKFCLGCAGLHDYEIVRATDREGREHTYGGTWPVASDYLKALVAVAEAAFSIRDYDDAGGNEWWQAHAELYLALEAFHRDCGESVRNGD